MKEIITKQIEIYSNSIIAFNVLQGLAYLYYFGSNSIFNCHVKGNDLLAEIITLIFIFVTVLSIIAIRYLGQKFSELASEYEDVISVFTKGKMVVVAIFGFFPAFVTFKYGVLVEVPKLCVKLLA